MKTLKNQRGVTLSGFIMVAVVGISISMIAFKLIPPYMENAKIQKAFDAIVQDAAMQAATPADIRDAFGKRANVMDSVTKVTQNDIEVNQDNGRLALSATYSVKIPLVSNISILIEFNPHAPRL